LSNGAACVAYCAPVLVPFLLGEGRSVTQNLPVLARFLAGRLAGYLVFGILVWTVAKPVFQSVGSQELVVGPAFVVLAVLLVFYGFFHREGRCPLSVSGRLAEKLSGKSTFFIPLVAGLATGLSFCPPFLLATAAAADKGELSEVLLFFFLFFVGTSVFFVPVPFLGFFRAYGTSRTIGRLASGLMGIYYFYTGLIMIVGGIHKL
jgi:sulfite exporter TauE/SafE